MTSAQPRLIAATGGRLTPADGLPDLFLPLINDHWLSLPAATVFVAFAAPRAADAWLRLGDELLATLTHDAPLLGLCLDGDWPSETMLSWLRQTDAAEEPAAVNLQWLRRPHPVLPQMTRNVRWLSQHQPAPGWLPELWRTGGSNRFNAGCAALVVAYPAGSLTLPAWDEPLTVIGFGATLARAGGWLIPLDEDIGFLVGARLSTAIHARMLAQSPASA